VWRSPRAGCRIYTPGSGGWHHRHTANINHRSLILRIGKGLKTKVHANIGNSSAWYVETETGKLAVVSKPAPSVMDLSRRNVNEFAAPLLPKALCYRHVPIYQPV
jgi:thiamine biosynthesis protein ThiC